MQIKDNTYYIYIYERGYIGPPGHWIVTRPGYRNPDPVALICPVARLPRWIVARLLCVTRTFWISRHFLKFHDISWNVLTFLEFSWNFMKFQKQSWFVLKFQTKSRNVMTFQEIFWNSEGPGYAKQPGNDPLSNRANQGNRVRVTVTGSGYIPVARWRLVEPGGG